MITNDGHDVPEVAMDSMNEQAVGELPPVRSLEPTPAEPDARPSESDPSGSGSPHLRSPEPNGIRAYQERRLLPRNAPLFKSLNEQAGLETQRPNMVPADSVLISGKLYVPLQQTGSNTMSQSNQRALMKARVGFEYFFSHYLLKLDFISECGEGGVDLTEASQLALEQSVHIVTCLREAMSVILSASLASRDEHSDPFFQKPALPHWGVVEPDTVVVENEISVAEYVHRLSRLHPEIGLHPVLSELTTMFSIGISAEPEHQGKHLLIMPPQMELMNALCNGDLVISWP